MEKKLVTRTGLLTIREVSREIAQNYANFIDILQFHNNNNNNNNNKTVLMERLSPTSLSAIQTRYSELKNIKQKVT